MAEEIKKDAPKGSTIKKIKEPDFSNEITITKLSASKEMIDWHFNKMKDTFGEKLTNEDIWKRIHSLVLRDNIFNESMKIIVPCYEIKIDPEQLKQIAEIVKKNNKDLEKAPQPYIDMVAQRMIEKQMVFACLAKEWKIEVKDEEAKTMLENYYKQTNQPIRDMLNNPKAMQGIKNTMLEQKIADEVCKKLKYKIDWETVKKNAEESRKQTQAAKPDAKKVEESTNPNSIKPIEK